MVVLAGQDDSRVKRIVYFKGKMDQVEVEIVLYDDKTAYWHAIPPTSREARTFPMVWRWSETNQELMYSQQRRAPAALHAVP